MNIQQKINKIKKVLDDLKAEDIKSISLTGKTQESEEIIIATARSKVHLKATANNIKLEAKHINLPIIGYEGVENGQWAIVDLAFVVVHIMTAEARKFYQLEKLWGD